MDKIYLIILTSLLLSVNSIAQDSNSLISNNAGNIEVFVNQEDGKYFLHTMQRGETIYRIAKKYATKSKDILELNKIKDVSDIDIATLLKIPLNNVILDKVPTEKASRFTYRAQAKDNIYRISKVYFDLEIESFMKLNKLKSLNLSIDQEFIIGYFNNNLPDSNDGLANTTINQEIELEVSSDEVILKDSIEVITKNQLFSDSTANLRATNEVEEAPRNLRQTRGIAVWNQNSKDKENMFALHRTAKIGSIVEIYNPLLKRKAFAKVVASIPGGVYPTDVSIILSKRVVDALGALDGRFQVEMKFYE